MIGAVVASCTGWLIRNRPSRERSYCGWFLVEKYDKKRGAWKACVNPACDYLHSQEEEQEHAHAPVSAQADPDE